MLYIGIVIYAMNNCTIIYEIVRNLSVITAVEEFDGRDSSVVRRLIEIVSNPRHNQS